MIFNVDKEDIFNALNIVSTVIEKKSPIPVLTNVCIRANEDGTIVLEGSNLINHIRAKVIGNVFESGEMTVSSQKFLSMVKEATGDISIKYAKGGIAYMSFGKVNTELAVTDPITFPTMKHIEGKQFKVNRMVFANKLSKAVNFVSHDETRKMLTGVNIKTNESELKIAATNAYQLFSSVIVGNFKSGVNIILPDKSAKLIQSVCMTGDDEGDVEITTNENSFVVKYNNYELFSLLIDANYPKYENIIPDYNAFATIDRGEIKRNVRLASIVMDEFDKSLSLNFKNSELTVHSQNSNSEKVTNNMSIVYDGNENEISINSEFFTTVLNNISSKEVSVYFDMEECDKKPLIIKSDHDNDCGDLFLVMPVRS